MKIEVSFENPRNLRANCVPGGTYKQCFWGAGAEKKRFLGQKIGFWGLGNAKNREKNGFSGCGLGKK